MGKWSGLERRNYDQAPQPVSLLSLRRSVQTWHAMVREMQSETVYLCVRRPYSAKDGGETMITMLAFHEEPCPLCMPNLAREGGAMRS